MLKQISFLLLLTVFIHQRGFSQFKPVCRVQYKYEIYHPGKPATYYEGSRIGRQMVSPAQEAYYETAWSKNYTLYVSFYSGEYLKEISSKYSFNDNEIIAIIEWKDGGASVIRVNNYTSKYKEIISLSKGIQLTGYDQNERYWVITIPEE